MELFVALMGVTSMGLLAHKKKAGLWAYVAGQIPWFYMCIVTDMPWMAGLSFLNTALSMHGLKHWGN